MRPTASSPVTTSVSESASNTKTEQHDSAPAPSHPMERSIQLEMENGTFGVYYWKPGMTEVVKGNMVVSNGTVSDQKFRGSLFTNAPSKTEARVYKIESIAFSEESFVEISATFHHSTVTEQ